MLSCDLGTIVDVSRHGIMLRTERPIQLQVGSEIVIELHAPTDTLQVKAKVMRFKRSGGRAEIGLDFADLTESDRSSIDNLARFGRRSLPGVIVNEETRDRVVAALKMTDFYHLLGVSPQSSAEQIHAAYRLLARKYHPDVCKEEGALERFCLLNDAHSTLTSADRRQAYDELYALRRSA